MTLFPSKLLTPLLILYLLLGLLPAASASSFCVCGKLSSTTPTVRRCGRKMISREEAGFEGENLKIMNKGTLHFQSLKSNISPPPPPSINKSPSNRGEYSPPPSSK